MQIKEQRFKALFLSESGRMYKAAYILLGDEDEAKDVVQDVFAKLWAGTIPLKEEVAENVLADLCPKSLPQHHCTPPDTAGDHQTPDARGNHH